MKILLIDILRTSLEEVWPSAEHSLGLMYLAASLRERFGEEVTTRIWTLVSRPRRAESDRLAVLEQLTLFVPDLVGIRCLSIGKDAFHLVARTAKGWNRDCLVVAGGPYATDDPEEALGGDSADCVVIGEGEETLNVLVDRVRSGQPWKDVPGIAYREDGGVLRSPPRPLIEDLDALPFPDYALVDLERFSNQFLTFTSKISKPHANVMTTRGCPYKCAYCHNILGKKFRARSPENVLAEIRHVHDTHGITDFQIIDDIFNLDLPRARTDLRPPGTQRDEADPLVPQRHPRRPRRRAADRADGGGRDEVHLLCRGDGVPANPEADPQAPGPRERSRRPSSGRRPRAS